MKLKKITLSNIRSYSNETVEFHDGRVMLSGDIGSGKSTILLAAEFALFGILRGTINGSALLRHGAKQGSVELNFEISGKDITIYRTLKMSHAAIGQGTGHIIIDGVKESGTAVELKARILSILGYPKSLLSKSKNLIFRYTVFTPQEEMKAILFESPDERLDILRKIFGVDRYRIIIENSAIISKTLRLKRTEYSGYISDLDDKLKSRSELEEVIRKKSDEKSKLSEPLKSAKENVKKKREMISEIEKNIEELNRVNQSLASLDTELRSNIRRISELKKEYDGISSDIENEKKEIRPDIDSGKIKLEIRQREEKINALEKEMQKINQEQGAINQKLNEAVALKDKILNLDKCPFCKQQIRESHKKEISRSQGDLEAESNKIRERLKSELGAIKEEKDKAREDLSRLQKKHSEAELMQLRKKALKQKKVSIERIEVNISTIKRSVGDINSKKIELESRAKQLREFERDYNLIKEELNEAMKVEKGLEVSYAEVQKEIDTFNIHKSELDKEIAKKNAIKEKLEKISSLHNWIDDIFRKLVINIEKAVMSRVYHEFNELFIQWFNVLIEDDNLNVKLDQDFAPVIIQNGYESEISNLSGGEKTACALAYRLSLNKVINDLMSTIKTRDIIILDEPTDGFSSEQLDKLRDVLDMLGIKQTILVSHESKIESYVDHVIRVNKENQISKIA